MAAKRSTVDIGAKRLMMDGELISKGERNFSWLALNLETGKQIRGDSGMYVCR